MAASRPGESTIPMSDTIYWVPPAEFERARRLNAPAEARAALFADLARLDVLAMIAEAGSGHIGTSFSCLDILSWLHLETLEGNDLFFSSKGHDAPALYTVMAATGKLPFAALRTLRRQGGLPGHPDVKTPGIVANTGSLGMGVSKAKGMAFARRRSGSTGRIFVLTGDGELQEGQFWESLASAANHGLGEVWAIVDHNKIQSDTWVADTSDLGDVVAKAEAFGWAAARVDGHNIAAFAATLGRLAAGAPDRPKLILADTVKGKGVSFMEGRTLPADGLYKFHSGAPDAATYGRAVAELRARADAAFAAAGSTPVAVETAPYPQRGAPPATAQRLVAAYGAALVEAAAREPRLVALDGDLVLDTGLIPFRARYPDRFVECGIAEQDMVSQAGGMALAGLVPVCHSFACFMTPRANEQAFNNASEGTHVLYAGSLAGLVPAGPGHSHQSLRDIALMGNLPGLVAIEPATEAGAAAAVEWAVFRHAGPAYIRLVSIPCVVPEVWPAGWRLEEGRGTVLAEGGDAVLIAYGPVMLREALAAHRLLADRHGIGLRVVELPWLNTVNDGWLVDTVGARPLVVTLDNHTIHGGQGQFLAARLAARAAVPARGVLNLGIVGLPLCGTNDEALAHHGLDADGIAGAISARMAADAAGERS